MTRPAMAVPIALLVSTLTACRPDEPRPPAAGASAAAAVASGRQDTAFAGTTRSEEHTSELQSRLHLVCRLLLEKKNHSSSSFAGFDISSFVALSGELTR